MQGACSTCTLHSDFYCQKTKPFDLFRSSATVHCCTITFETSDIVQAPDAQCNKPPDL